MKSKSEYPNKASLKNHAVWYQPGVCIDSNSVSTQSVSSNRKGPYYPRVCINPDSTTTQMVSFNHTCLCLPKEACKRIGGKQDPTSMLKHVTTIYQLCHK